jgi:hypothetical protein
MRREVLAVFALALLLAPVFALTQQAPDQPHGDIRIDCGECHNPERWVPVDKPPTFRHDSTGFQLEGAHRQASCKGCHRTLVFNRVATACADCHRDAHRGELGARCESCHTPHTWTNQSAVFRAHNRSRFPMMAVHARLDCEACHKGQQPYQYATTPAECGNCHLPTYLATTNPNHAAAGFSRRCEDCHSVTANSWHESTFSHPAQFPLAGGHGGIACARCHTGGRPCPIPSDCVSCHRDDYNSAANPSNAGGGIPTSCQDCHTTTSWRPALFDHSKAAFPLTGAHLRTDCAKCHTGGRYQGTPKDCYSCHKANYDGTATPNHRAAGIATSCQDCHNTGAWKPANFDHDNTRFRLTGAHQRTDCARCHTGGRYTGTPTDCWSCHQASYNATTNPNHAASGFPKDCQTCHGTSAWRPASVDHSKTRFPLTGAHQRTDCARCHTGGRYTGTPTDCWSCHQANYNGAANPNHVASNLPRECQACHTTSAWRPATVDHNRTRFPLTGAHTRVDCARCHTGGRYTGTPTDCYACHQANYAGTTNPNHSSAGFPTQCAECHSTAAWRPATFDHDGRYFPIYSGKHRGKWSSCSDCHVSAGNYKAFECVLCHEHSNRREVDDKHKEVNGYVYGSAACYQCHRNGRAGARGPIRRLPE